MKIAPNGFYNFVFFNFVFEKLVCHVNKNIDFGIFFGIFFKNWNMSSTSSKSKNNSSLLLQTPLTVTLTTFELNNEQLKLVINYKYPKIYNNDKQIYQKYYFIPKSYIQGGYAKINSLFKINGKKTLNVEYKEWLNMYDNLIFLCLYVHVFDCHKTHLK